MTFPTAARCQATRCHTRFALFLITLGGLILPTTCLTTHCRAQGSLLAGDAESNDALNAERPPTAPRFGEPTSYRWKVGVRIATSSSSFRNVLLTIPVPVNWPEQQVELIDENIPAEVGRIQYREGEGNLRQIVSRIQSIPARTLVEFDVTFRVTVRGQLPPSETASLVKPKPTDRELKDFLGVSPDISYRNGTFRRTVKEIVEGIEAPWKQTETIYDWIRENVENRDGPLQDSITTLLDRQGNPEDLVGLFVAMCRCNKVPARIVWVEGRQYAEFYLEDGEGTGFWYPCNLVGLREFGECSDPRVIQQKGDNMQVPERKDRLKFVNEFVTGKGKAKPKVQFIRQPLPDETP